MKTISINVYDFAELTKETQRKVLDKYREIKIDDDWAQPVIEGFNEDLHAMGITANVRFTGFWSQGDGACFITENGGTVDTDLLIRRLHEQGYAIPENCLLYSKDISVNIRKKDASYAHHYEHENTIIACVYNEDKHIVSDSDCNSLESVITQWAREKSRTLYNQLEKYYNELTSDEMVTQAIQESNMTFLSNGQISPANA